MAAGLSVVDATEVQFRPPGGRPSPGRAPSAVPAFRVRPDGLLVVRRGVGDADGEPGDPEAAGDAARERKERAAGRGACRRPRGVADGAGGRGADRQLSLETEREVTSAETAVALSGGVCHWTRDG